MSPIVLASASPRRKALLEALGIVVRVEPSGADEILDGDPDAIVLHNAILKRDEVAKRLTTDAFVIAADTIVVLDGHVMGKPANLDDACAMVGRLSGRTHEVKTGVAVLDSATGRKAEAVETTGVTFRALTREEIDLFVQAVNPLDRAGAYTVDGPGSLLVSAYRGCYQNVLGLPIVCLDQLMCSLGDGLFSRMDASRSRFL